MDNVFERSKARYLVGWVVLSFVLSFFVPDFKYSTNLLLLIILYFIPLWWFNSKLKKDGQSLRHFFPKPFPIKKTTLMASVVMTLVFAVGMLLLVIAAILFLFPEAENMILPSQPKEVSLGFFIFNMINLVIIAPVCEEIIFRGFVLGRLTYKFGVNKGIIFSSFIFGVMHFTNVFGAAMFGIILCILYIKSNSLITTIIVHAFYNAVVACGDIYSFIDEGNYSGNLSAPPLYPTMIVALLCTIIALLWIVPFLKKNWQPAPLVYENQVIEQ